ncbi:MAG: filamentous hemagglutinin N-terminal domain-containing protein [Limnothrix sp. RL_2_0]|nr:filamentous hemagglutinin N-terminal domain-containing protein [Limnothrix sp. RL_2_0]
MNFSVMLRWLIFLISLGFSLPVIAQPITSSSNATGTTVNQSGKQFDIGGGALSGDAKNLFHDFDRFGLNQGQIANFLSQPNIENILGRVSGGETSFINGLLQITGGNSNLYLLNPTGIIFGENARLNIAGDFTATTATGIKFEDNWFSAFGENDYVNLVGEPTQFLFDLDNPQNIINQGNLTVTEGQSLNLFAGSIRNAGTLQARSGQINIQRSPTKMSFNCLRTVLF